MKETNIRAMIGTNQQQPAGFDAFIPAPFPPPGATDFSQPTLAKAARAHHLIGKLDGITHILPDVDFFLYMFVQKDATSSAQIEGTKATMVDALEMDAGVATQKTDASDILYYVQALNYGAERLKELPLSLRLIREIHALLMTGARSTHFADPGHFRKSQNWIGGTSPASALFVPPPVDDMSRALDDFEAFLHSEAPVLPLFHIALIHAQFETIHPFLDGNGRTGRLLISMLLYHQDLLERPALFLSSYFRKHQKLYYNKLHGYHENEIEEWVDFFLDGVLDTANESISVCKEITKRREHDMEKIQALGKRESESGVLILRNLYSRPIVTTRTVMEWTGFTRAGAKKVIDRFIDLEVLYARDPESTYDRSYIYKDYVNIFVY